MVSGRALVLAAVSAEPGLSKTELMQRTSLAWGTIHYYVVRLCKEASISQVADGRRIRLYPGASDPSRCRQVIQERPLSRRTFEALQG
jgi:predicted transcriptional regulator